MQPNLQNVNHNGVVYDVRTVLFLLTNLLVPGYLLLSFLAIFSRYNGILKGLAAHGKTSMAKEATERKESSSPRWYWVSKRCFVHFYYVGILSILFTSMYREKLYHRTDRCLSRATAVGLLAIHVIRRAYECLYIQQYRDESSKMNIAGYALGVGHYLVLPLVFWDIDATYSSNDNVGTGGENRSIAFGNKIHSSERSTISILPIFIVVIAALNIWLQYEQHMHHVILADIRRFPFIQKKICEERKAGCRDIHLRQIHYSRPPYRRWFRYVLAPHYLAEILLYLSFAMILEMGPVTEVLSGSLCRYTSSDKNFDELLALNRIAGLLLVSRRYRHWMLFMWVATNLTISAMNNYDWYNSNCNTKNATEGGDHFSNGAATSHRQETASFDERSAIFPKIL